jgi:hypothetical protein
MHLCALFDISAPPFPAKRAYNKRRLFKIDLIITPVTGSRGNAFCPLLAPVVGAFEAFSLCDEIVVDV